MPERNNNTAIPHNNYKYSGKELDQETMGGSPLDWYYFGARYYDAEIARFLTVDPLTSIQPDVNPYHYCHNNPINLIDPTGMNDEKPDDKKEEKKKEKKEEKS